MCDVVTLCTLRFARCLQLSTLLMEWCCTAGVKGMRWKQRRRLTHALSTRAGIKCVAHVLQVFNKRWTPKPRSWSIDGVGAYDSISRKAMLEALMGLPRLHTTSDFSTANPPGICGEMDQARFTTWSMEGGCSRFLGTVDNILQKELHQHSRIHINIGKIHVWNAAGIRPPACD